MRQIPIYRTPLVGTGVLDGPAVTGYESTLDSGEFVLPTVRTVEDAGPYKRFQTHR